MKVRPKGLRVDAIPESAGVDQIMLYKRPCINVVPPHYVLMGGITEKNSDVFHAFLKD